VKFLVATREPQRPHDDDFNFALPGEPVTLGTAICATAEARRECGCGQSFSGLQSQYATTYAEVAEVTSVDEAAFRASFHDSPHVHSWATDSFPVERAGSVMWAEMAEIGQLIEDQPAGTEVRANVTQTTFTLILPDGSRREGRRSGDLEALIAAALNESGAASAYLSGTVSRKELPILLVVHEEDGDWQFLDGGTVDPDDCVVVHVEHVFEDHGDLAAVADLPRGWAAERATVDTDWHRYTWPSQGDET
jgi:hypothetical protein